MYKTIVFPMFGLIILWSLVVCASSRPNGFILKLIHIHSPLSPFYQPNISSFERFKLNVQISMQRQLFSLEHSKLTSLNATIRRFPFKKYLPFFTVEVGIGNPVVQKTLVFDPSSRYTWIQCKPCLKCFKQDKPLYDSSKSTSYKRVTILNAFNKGFYCDSVVCKFHQDYAGGFFVSGKAALEKFTFQTTTRGVPYKTNHIGFGCGTKTNINYFPPTIHGVLGFSHFRASFARQLRTSRFSYCVPPISETNTSKGYTYLKFGDDAVMENEGGIIDRIPLDLEILKKGYYGFGVNYGYSINGERLDKALYSTRYVIDLSTPFTSLRYEVFSEVERKLQDQFAKFGVSRVRRTKLPSGMETLTCCYSHPSDFKNFPDMTLHFHLSEFHIPPENLFIHVPESNISCLAMVMRLPSPITDQDAILGVYQQQNMRFVFDLSK